MLLNDLSEFMVSLDPDVIYFGIKIRKIRFVIKLLGSIYELGVDCEKITTILGKDFVTNGGDPFLFSFWLEFAKHLNSDVLSDYDPFRVPQKIKQKIQDSSNSNISSPMKSHKSRTLNKATSLTKEAKFEMPR